MNGSGWLGEQAAIEEKGWTFGQLMSVLLMMAAPLSVMNALRSKFSFKISSKKCKLTVDSAYKDKQTEDKEARMYGFHPYQPVHQGSQMEMQHLMR
jgi:hypothetical protein